MIKLFTQKSSPNRPPFLIHYASTMNISSTELLASSLSNPYSLSSALPSRGAAIECPKCGKHTVVKRSPNHFDCLNCSFQKSLSPVAHASTGSAYPPRQLSASSNLHRLQQQATRAVIEQQQHRYSAYERDSDNIHPLLFAASAVIFGMFLL